MNKFKDVKRDIMRLALEDSKELRLLSFVDILKSIIQIEDELEESKAKK